MRYCLRVAAGAEDVSPVGEGARVVRGGEAAEVGEGFVVCGEGPGGAGESGEGVCGAECGKGGAGSDGLAPEGVFLRGVEEETGFDAVGEESGPLVVEPGVPGEDSDGWVGGELGAEGSGCPLGGGEESGSARGGLCDGGQQRLLRVVGSGAGHRLKGRANCWALQVAGGGMLNSCVFRKRRGGQVGLDAVGRLEKVVARSEAAQVKGTTMATRREPV